MVPAIVFVLCVGLFLLLMVRIFGTSKGKAGRSEGGIVAGDSGHGDSCGDGGGDGGGGDC